MSIESCRRNVPGIVKGLSSARIKLALTIDLIFLWYLVAACWSVRQQDRHQPIMLVVSGVKKHFLQHSKKYGIQAEKLTRPDNLARPRRRIIVYKYNISCRDAISEKQKDMMCNKWQNERTTFQVQVF